MKCTQILLFNNNADAKAFQKMTTAPQWRYYGNLNATWPSSDLLKINFV